MLDSMEPATVAKQLIKTPRAELINGTLMKYYKRWGKLSNTGSLDIEESCPNDNLATFQKQRCGLLNVATNKQCRSTTTPC